MNIEKGLDDTTAATGEQTRAAEATADVEELLTAWVALGGAHRNWYLGRERER